MDRREFLKRSGMTLAAAAATTLAATPVVKILDNELNTKKEGMGKKILILNGSPRKNGHTAALVKAFIEGAEGAGHEVRHLYLNGMNIHGCLACEACSRNGGECVQQDDMDQVNEGYEWADVLVFASPEFWGTISGQLKTTIDRLYAIQNKLGYFKHSREMVLLMTARGNDFRMALDFYHIFTEMMGWPDRGTVLGRGKVEEARALGASI